MLGKVTFNYANLFLSFFKLGKRDQEAFIQIIFSKEFHGSFIDGACTADVMVLLLKASILDPVLYFRMNNNKCIEVKENNILKNHLFQKDSTKTSLGKH